MSIQLQNAARVSNDATAEEENVQKGKVFYNNSGRHVGVAEIEASTPYTVNVTNVDTGDITYNASSTPFYYFNTTTKTIDSRRTTSSYTRLGGNYYSVQMPYEYKRLVGITYNSTKYTVSSTNTMLICTNDDRNSSQAVMAVNITGSATLNHYVYVFIPGTYTFHYI